MAKKSEKEPMRTSVIIPLLLFVSLAPAAHSQVLQTGEIVTVANALNAYDLVAVGGATSTPHFPALGHAALSTLWDPTSPDDLYFAGQSWPNGFLTRVRLGSGTPIVTTIATLPGHRDPARMVWSQAGTEIVYFDRFSDQIYRVATTPGSIPVAITSVSPTQFWGSGLNCGTIDPSTGDFYVGTTSGDIYRVQSTQPSAAASISLVAVGVTASIVDLEFDPLTPGVLVICSPTQILKLDLTTLTQQGLATSPGLASLPGNFESIALDQFGDFVIAVHHQWNLPDLWHLPNVSCAASPCPAPSFIGDSTAFTNNLSDIAVIGGTQFPFRLTVSLNFGTLDNTISVINLPAGTASGYSLVSLATPFPLGQGGLFGIHPDSLTFTGLLTPPSPDNFFHWTLPTTHFPSIPLSIPLAAVPGAQSADLVILALDSGGNFLGNSNVARSTY